VFHKLPDWWGKRFLRVELLLSIGIGVVVAAVALMCDGWWIKTIDKAFDSNRGAVYGSLASIFGALLGFVITSISIVLGFTDDTRFLQIRSSESYSHLWRIFTSSVRVFGAATGTALVSLMVDRDSRPCHAMQAFCFWVVLLATFRLVRTVWVLEELIGIAIKNDPAQKKA
jgi:hypothetical protein